MSSQHRADRGDQRAGPGAPARSPAPPGTGIAVPDRATVLAATATAMSGSGQRWAWQGPADARERWLRETGPKDLDVWCDGRGDPGTDPATALGTAVRCARIAAVGNPGRLRHVILAAETADGPAVVDLDYGDLRIGPVLLVPAEEIRIDPDRLRFTGAAAVADLLVRPVLRGRLPDPARLAEARAAWAATGDEERHRLVGRLRAQHGAGVARRLLAALGGDHEADRSLPQRAQLRLVLHSLAPGNIAATWAERTMIVPAGTAAGPLGLRVRGVVVALVGTDGSGKSTVADELDQRLRRFGMRTGTAYFGMGRGNLPGVDLARRLLGVAPPATSGTTRTAGTGTAGASGADQPVARSMRRPYLRRLAAWYYAGEYLWRYLRHIAPQLLRRRVVIVDRWVYDLRESPWPGSPAADVVRRLVPEPDILVLPDAPAELIHTRKPERPLAEQATEQERFRRLLAERPARHAELVVDTSGATADCLAELVTTVVEVAHRPRREPRRR